MKEETKSWLEECEEYARKQEQDNERRLRLGLWDIKQKAVEDGRLKAYMA